MATIRLTLNGAPITVADVPPTTTLLQFLRRDLHLTGTKEGCAEGDCGACTVAVLDEEAEGGATWRAVNSCLLLLPSLQGRTVVTVDGLREGSTPHTTQSSLTQALGSQCGYCTPGVIMSMFEATYRADLDAPWKLDDQMCGNLCRCTGYRPIREATEAVAGSCPADRFSAALQDATRDDPTLAYEADGHAFHLPTSMDDLFDVLDAHPDHRLVTGATDLGLDVTKKHATWPCLVSLEGLTDLKHIRETADGWSIGAAVPLADVESWADSALVPLARMLRFFGSRQIKNRATLGGNLCNASPIGDTPPVLLALGATLVARSRSGERRIPVDDFFVAYRKTALQPGEILARIEIPRPPADALIGTYKVSKRREMDISAVAAGMWVRLEEGGVTEARLAYGGMAATPSRAAKAEAALLGQPWTEATVRAAMTALAGDFTPLSDHRGSAWYRATVAANLLLGFYTETLAAPVVALPDRPTGTIVLPEVRP